MTTEAGEFSIVEATIRWEEHTGLGKHFDLGDLFLLGLDILRIRALEAGVSFIQNEFTLKGFSADREIDLMFSNRDTEIPDTLYVTYHRDGGFPDDLLEITKEGERGSERFIPRRGLGTFRSELSQSMTNEGEGTRAVTLEQEELDAIGNNLWQAHRRTPDEIPAEAA